ncbi:MAG: hypothetical protein WDN75_00110 [Bacteroidota bacterium]
MKKVIMIAAMAAVTSLNVFAADKENAREQMVMRVVNALKQSSAFSYTELIPSISELHNLMKENSELYGPYLQEAGREMSNEYAHKFLPAVEEAFESVIEEGKRKGIDWSNIRFVNFEYAASENEIPSDLTVVFLSNGKQYKVQIAKAFFVNGQFRVNQFIRFV